MFFIDCIKHYVKSELQLNFGHFHKWMLKNKTKQKNRHVNTA